MTRRALLLALAQYDSCGDLDYVRRDIPRMKQALGRMGVPNDHIVTGGAAGGGTEEVLSLARLRKRIREFLKTATEGEDLLVYFSGHGAVLDGHRVIIAQDFDQEDPRPGEQISDLWLLQQARSSQAASVLFLIDACRDGYTLTLSADGNKSTEDKSTEDKSTASSQTSGADDTPTIGFVYSCALGESSGRDGSDPQGCSAFTRAFAETLEAEGERVHLREVIDDAGVLLNRYVPSNRRQTLTLGDLRTCGRAGDLEALVLKDSVIAQLRARLEQSRWVRQLKTCTLWQSLEPHSPALARQLEVIVLHVEDQVAAAKAALPQQAWRVDDAPFRMLDRRTNHLQPALNLTIAERALLLAVPFVYELVLATAEHWVAAVGLDPDACAKQAGESAFLRAWRTAVESDEASKRMLARLKNRDDPWAAQAMADVQAWRFNTFCHGAGELWNRAGDGWAIAAVQAAVQLAPLPEVVAEPRIAELLQSDRLLRLARLMFAAYEDVSLDLTAPTKEQRAERFALGDGVVSCEDGVVAHTLNLAARLALDARRLPPLLAEHLGCDERLTLASVQSLLLEARWGEDNRVLSLCLSCPHEALDAALREAVDDLDAYRRRLCGSGNQRLAVALPAAYTTGDLMPEVRNGTRRYDPEHLRFSLDQGKVIQLLMGKELYGDPALALRELYQNALDACRYRRAQEQSWRKTAEVPPWGAEYRGQITFRFGKEDGRPFIECTDNGIGMADRHLRGLFATAGKRFTDSHEYHLDKARWEQADVPFWPNSRFGIGVLSYFMLAEELEVASQRVTAAGETPPPRVHARVLGSGSLFRLDNDDATRFADGGGTRVRLYLQDRQASLYDYRQAMLTWLWLPDFETILRVDGVEAVVLSAGQPTSVFQENMGQVIPMHGSADSHGIARAYWCVDPGGMSYAEGASAILVDGIVTETFEEPFSFRGVTSDRFPPHVCLNMTEGLTADLTVDRNSVGSVEVAASFIRQCVDGDGWRDLALLKRLPQRNIWKLSRVFPLALVRWTECARTGGASDDPIRIVDCVGRVKSSLPQHVGLCDIDSDLFAPFNNYPDRTSYQATFSPMVGELLLARFLELRMAECVLPVVLSAPLVDAAQTVLRRRWHGGTCPASVTLLFSDSYDGRSPPLSPDGTIDPYLLLEVLLTGGLSFADLHEILQPFYPVLPSLQGIASDPGPSPRYLQRLVSRDLDGDFPLVERLTPGHLMRAASTWNMSYAEIVPMAKALATLGVPIANVLTLDGPSASPERLGMLVSCHLNGEAPFVQALTPRHLLQAAAWWEMPFAEVVALASPLAAIGLPLPAMVRADAKLTGPHLRLMSCHLDGEAPFVELLTPFHVLKAAWEWQTPMAEVVALARSLTAWGVRLSDAVTPETLSRVTEQHVRLLSCYLDGTVSFVETLTASHLLGAARKWGISHAAMMDLVGLLVTLEVPGAVLLNLADMPELSPQQAQLLSRDRDGNAPFITVLTVEHLLRAAEEWGMTFSEVVALARPLAAVGLPLPDALMAEPLPALTGQHVQLMRDGPVAWGSVVRTLTPRHLFRAAEQWGMTFSEVVALARPMAAVGLPVPAILGDDPLPALNEKQVFLLSRNLDGEAPFVGALTLPHLLRAADQWGLPLTEVVALAKSLAALGLSLPQAVTEQQGQLISCDLDGRPPFVDALTPLHLLRAADRWAMSFADVKALASPLSAWGYPPPDIELSEGSLFQIFRLLSVEDDGKEVINDQLSLFLQFRAAYRERISFADALDLLAPIRAWYGQAEVTDRLLLDSDPVVGELVERVYSEDSFTGPHTLSLWGLVLVADKTGASPDTLQQALDALEVLGVGNLDVCRELVAVLQEQMKPAAWAGGGFAPHPSVCATSP